MDLFEVYDAKKMKCELCGSESNLFLCRDSSTEVLCENCAHDMFNEWAKEDGISRNDLKYAHGDTARDQLKDEAV